MKGSSGPQREVSHLRRRDLDGESSPQDRPLKAMLTHLCFESSCPCLLVYPNPNICFTLQPRYHPCQDGRMEASLKL